MLNDYCNKIIKRKAKKDVSINERIIMEVPLNKG